MADIIDKYNQEFEKILEHLRQELKSLRTGRASTALVENLKVDVYGTNQELKGLAQISVPESRQIIIQPWDKSTMQAIEKAIQQSNLGVNPTNEGSLLRISLPPLTEERRKELTKVVHEWAEKSRISVRNVRENIMKELKKMDDEGAISEDERFSQEEDVQKKITEMNNQIKEIADKKEQEIMTV